MGRLGKHSAHGAEACGKSPEDSPLGANRCCDRPQQRKRQCSKELARGVQHTLPAIRACPRMERQDLSQLRRIHRRRPRTDASNLAQPENVGNTIQQTLEQNRPRTTPSVQSRKLDRNPKTLQANTALTPENERLSSEAMACEPRGNPFLESLYRIESSNRFQGRSCDERRV